jgi:NTE family protein
MTEAAANQDIPARRILVLQGGGALGAYQGGVYEAMAEAGIAPEWVAGISIGAINAAIIAGNAPEARVARLREFWELVSSGPTLPLIPLTAEGLPWVNDFNAAWAASFGVPGLFSPRVPPAVLSPPGSPDAVSVYDSAPLRRTLERLVDFDRINAKQTRLSVGAVNVRTGNFAYFDNCRHKIGPEHIMASGALPVALPPIEIDGEHYWDGGLVSNTPLQYVLDEDRINDLLIYQVDLFAARGQMPRTLGEAAEREKEIRFSSRTRFNTDQSLKIHELKAALRSLIESLPQDQAADPSVELLAAFSKENAVSIVQLIHRRRPEETAAKDYEFSRRSMHEHWAAGAKDVRHSLRQQAKIEARPADGGSAVFDPGLAAE